MRLTRPTYQRALAALAAFAATPLAAPAAAQPTLVIRGAGFGHGVGMSQQGAEGYALHGYDYRTILARYYTGTSIGTAPARAVVRVLLQANQGRVSVSGAAQVGGQRLNGKSSYTVSLSPGGRGVTVRTGARRAVTAPVLRFTAPHPLTLRGAASNGLDNGVYRGALEVRPAAHGGINAINVVHVDDYVRGVVAAEMPPSWAAAALQAQAVASRTYGLTSHDGPAGVFDVYADTRSQLYRGVAGEQRPTNAATAATAGQIVTYAGRPAITYFFAASGGRTENVENAFPGAAAEPWLRGVIDPYESGPLHTWGPLRMSFSSAAARLGGLVRGSFQGIEVMKRGFSPRIITAYVLGSGGSTPVTGDELAARLGLYDTWAYFSVLDSSGEHPEPDRSGQPPASGGPTPASPPAGSSGGTPAG